MPARSAFEKEAMTKKTLRARRSPGRSATARAAIQHHLSAPMILPIGQNLRAQWRRSCEGTERRGVTLSLKPLSLDPTQGHPS